MKTIRVSAPGKLHLLGEHAVVYGKPAIIAAVDKRCFVEVNIRQDKQIEISSENLGAKKLFTEKEIILKTRNAQSQWEAYIKNNDISFLKSITSDPLDFPAIVIGEALKYLKKLSFGFTLSIKSDIPIGSGMGSSAALAVSIAGAMSLLFNKKIDKEVVNDIAFLSEQKKHGFPSGGDNSASCFGGLIWYRKETSDLKIIKQVPFAFPQKLAKNFVAIHTGTPVESTGEMVSLVRNLYQKRPKLVEGILSSQEKLTRDILSAIKNDDDALMIYIIKAGEKNLESLGVVSDSTKSFIRKVEDIGGVAKICGAGGKTKASGMVLAYSKDLDIVKKIANKYTFKIIRIELGVEGLKQEGI